MIKKADERMIPRLKQIWQICFGDDAKGTDFVFGNLLCTDQMLVKTDENGQPVAMLNWKLLNFTTDNQPLPGAYIFGVATLPEYRGKGISTALMEKADELLRGQGARLACLVPAEKSLFDFYGQRGYDTWFYYKALRVRSEDIPKPRAGGALRAAALEDLHVRRNAAFGSRALFGSWEAEYLRYTGMECRFYGGEVLRFFGGDNGGYLVCYPRGNGILIKEAVFAPQDIGLLLAAVDGRYRAASYELRLPVDFEIYGKWASEILPFGMVKWYDSESVNALSRGSAPWFAFGLD